MNQTEKKNFWKNYQKWCWTFLQGGGLLAFFLSCLGPALWIQSVILSSMVLSFVVFLFSSQVKRNFKGEALKGYDPWHLQFLKGRSLPKVELIVHPHSTPFVLGYDFYKSKKLILSSAFLKHLKKGGVSVQLRGISLLFEEGFFHRFTWISYLFFVVFLPFQPFLVLFKNFSSIKNAVESVPAFLCFCILLPLRHWIHHQYYLADQNMSMVFKTKKQYAEWIWKMHTFWEVSSQHPPVFLSPLFFTNPLTRRPFCFNIHPRIEKRIEKLTGFFPV